MIENHIFPCRDARGVRPQLYIIDTMKKDARAVRPYKEDKRMLWVGVFIENKTKKYGI